MTLLSNLLFLSFIVGIPLYATYKKLNVFDSFIVGAKKGVNTTLGLLPYLVAMIVAIGMLRASGFFALFAKLLNPILDKIGMPPDLLPLALIRPFSGSAANGITAELIHHEGGNSIISKMAATIMGSTETTFYVIAIYFGAVSIKRTRHAIPTGLIADFAGVVASIVVCRLLFS
ncbi:MAG: spore maturation protein [Legionellales bacterium RIFCSPHIGHO2_12_FULL_37_14]|nr:MAG: spore maturation protein [Legionellales bacterium RIFCSPHIGHO2_12_FULL_37_14]